MLVKAAYMYVGPHWDAFRVDTCTWVRLQISSTELSSAKNHTDRVYQPKQHTTVEEVEIQVRGIVGKACHQMSSEGWADGVRAVKALVISERGAGYKIP